MRRKTTLIIIAGAALAMLSAGAFFLNDYWIHRYDDLIRRHAGVYNLEVELVWSIIYEETYFRARIVGNDREIGLMQVTPAVARHWGKQTGLKEFERETAENLKAFLSDPERNIQVGCWYLEQLRAKYRGFPAERAMTLAAYNAGPSRVDEWTRDADLATLDEVQFLERIAIPSTRSYVSSILARYKSVKAEGLLGK
jgi:soluble lytic murein transglycosylase